MALSGRMMLALLVILGLHSATATQFTVGTNGWTFQTGSNSVYTDQFQNTPLSVGDTLLFPFTSGVHNVYEIPPSDLASCNFANTIQTYTATNSVITLTTAGTHAFACQIPGHCSNGMQLSVTVTAAAPSASPSSSPTVAPVSPPTAAPVTTPTPASAPASPPTAAPVTTPTSAPAPTSRAPAPTPKAPTKAPAKAPTPSTGSVPGTQAPAPAPASPGDSGSSVISSGSGIIVAAVVAGFAFLLV